MELFVKICLKIKKKDNFESLLSPLYIVTDQLYLVCMAKISIKKKGSSKKFPMSVAFMSR